MSTNINSFFIIQLFVFMYREKIINQKYNYAYASERGRKITKARKKKRIWAEMYEGKGDILSFFQHPTCHQAMSPCLNLHALIFH